MEAVEGIPCPESEPDVRRIGGDMKNALRKSKHGGERPGAGRKEGSGFYGSRPISVKFTKTMVHILELEAKEQTKTISNLIREAVYEKYHPMADYI